MGLSVGEMSLTFRLLFDVLGYIIFFEATPPASVTAGRLLQIQLRPATGLSPQLCWHAAAKISSRLRSEPVDAGSDCVKRSGDQC
ncbi:hypothetical protein BH683_013030 [Williamsia sp. 1138]|nr:hypothetical protein BH683_013030 [Williamsia sp. 1138]